MDEADRDLLRRLDEAFCSLHDPMPRVYKEVPNTDARAYYTLKYDWSATAPRFAWDLTLLVDTLNDVGGEHLPQRGGIMSVHGAIYVKVWKSAELSRRRKRKRESREQAANTHAPAPSVPTAPPAKRGRPASYVPPPPHRGAYPPFQPAPAPTAVPPPSPAQNSLPLYPSPHHRPPSHAAHQFY